MPLLESGRRSGLFLLTPYRRENILPALCNAASRAVSRIGMEDMSQPRLLQVFLCHSSGDKEVVRLLNKRLTADGIETWLDEDKLLPGQDWRREIYKAVRKVDAVIVCLSRASTGKAGYVQKEIKYALDIAEEQPEGAIFIIPLRLEGCEVPSRLSQWQWVDYFSDQGYERLIGALRTRARDVGALVNPALDAADYPEEFYEEVFNKAFHEAFVPEHTEGAKASAEDKIITLLGPPRSGKSALIRALLGGREAPDDSAGSSTAIISYYNWLQGCVIADTAGPFANKRGVSSGLEKFLKRNTDTIFFLISPGDLRDASIKVTLSRLKRLDIPLLVILNKVDSLSGIEFGRIISHINHELNCPTVFISAEKNLNVRLISKYMSRALERLSEN